MVIQMRLGNRISALENFILDHTLAFLFVIALVPVGAVRVTRDQGRFLLKPEVGEKPAAEMM